MTESLRTINWLGVWEQCQETRRRRLIRGNGKRSDTRASEMSGAAASSDEDATIFSSYHLLTPTKLAPKEDIKTSSVAQRYIHHLESVQNKLNLRGSTSKSKTGRNADRKTGNGNGRSTLATPAESISGDIRSASPPSKSISITADQLLDAIFGQETASPREDFPINAEIKANNAEASVSDAESDPATHVTLTNNSSTRCGGKTGINPRITTADSKIDTATGVINDALEESKGGEEEAEEVLSPTNSLLTLKATNEQTAIETMVTDKDTQVMFCSVHNKFLTVKDADVKQREDEVEERRASFAGGRSDAVTRGKPKTALKRRMGLLAASLGGSILKRRKSAHVPKAKC